jgi:tryptophan 2,3-dioxygenase
MVEEMRELRRAMESVMSDSMQARLETEQWKREAERLAEENAAKEASISSLRSQLAEANARITVLEQRKSRPAIIPPRLPPTDTADTSPPLEADVSERYWARAAARVGAVPSDAAHPFRLPKTDHEAFQLVRACRDLEASLRATARERDIAQAERDRARRAGRGSSVEGGRGLY